MSKLKKKLRNLKKSVDIIKKLYYYCFCKLGNPNKQKGGDKVNYSKLRGKIKEVYEKNEPFAIALDIDPSSLSAKLNNKSPWKREEIEQACELLHIPIEKVYLYFFTKKVGETQLNEIV